MRISLWSRDEGLVRPPAELIHAVVGAHAFPQTFRTRVRHWAIEAVRRLQWGTQMGDVINPVAETWEHLYHGLCAAYGRQPLVRPSGPVAASHDIAATRQIPAHLASCPDNEVIDFIAAVFQCSAHMIEHYGGGAQNEPAVLGEMINAIFQEEGVGYRWVSGQTVRFDEPVTFEHAIEPAVRLLAEEPYGAANAEFSAAMEAYRGQRWRDAITNANAAYESVLKIRTGRPDLQAGPLIGEARRQGVIPGYLQAGAEHLQKLMHTLPAVRGQQGSAHGLAEKPSDADQHLAQLILGIAASLILFFGRAA